MVNFSKVAGYINDQVGNSNMPPSTSDVFENEGVRKFREVLNLANSSVIGWRKELEKDELITGNLSDIIASGITTDYSVESVAKEATIYATNVSTTAMQNIIENITENVSSIMQTVAEGNTSTFEHDFFNISGAMIGNTTTGANNMIFGNHSTMPGTGNTQAKHDVAFLAGVVLFCAVILIAHYIHMYCQARRQSNTYTPSQGVAKYQLPKIEEEETEFDGYISGDEAEQACGTVRNTVALVKCDSPKPKKRDYSPIPLAWDFDGKIVAQIGNEHVATDDSVEDSGTKPTQDDVDDAVTTEQLGKLKEECKKFEYMDA